MPNVSIGICDTNVASRVEEGCNIHSPFPSLIAANLWVSPCRRLRSDEFLIPRSIPIGKRKLNNYGLRPNRVYKWKEAKTTFARER